jgi:two-component system, sensor histidine kinase ChiS
LKSQFFANISHEFRTPLTLILGQIESVMSSAIDTKEKGKLQVANRNARRLLTLINELLDLSKLESGSMELAATRQNIVSFLKSLFYSFESLAANKKIELDFESEADYIPVSFDPDKMEKVFYNLVSNAFKFTSQNGRITVSLGIEQNERVIIRVKDTGIGIPEDRINLIFDRFYQVDASITREHEGTGIGLALTKELVELHKGTIAASSKVNVGTEILISLPLDTNGSGKTETVESSAKDILPDQAGSTPEAIEEFYEPDVILSEGKESLEMILVVEDNPDVRAYICEQLEENYRVTGAGNGEEGIKIAQDIIPDLIISDVMMPKMDGYQFSKAIRADEKTSHIPIIMLTARAGIDDKIDGLETGVDTYLTKPFNARELKANVKNLILQRLQLRKRFSKSTVIRPSDVSSVSADQVFLEKIVKTIETHFEDEQFSVESLAEHVNMSVSQLNRKLNALIDQPPGQLIRSLRLQRAADLLAQKAGSVSEICYQVGFNDNAYFSRAFKKQFGCSPLRVAANIAMYNGRIAEERDFMDNMALLTQLGIVSSQGNIAVVDGLYKSFAIGDIPNALAAMDPNIIWNEAEGFPYADRNPYIGPQAVLEGVFARIGEEWEYWNLTDIQMHEMSNNQVLSTLRYKAKYKKNGAEIDAHVAHWFTLKDGKIIRFQQFTDTGQVVRAMNQ